MVTRRGTVPSTSAVQLFGVQQITFSDLGTAGLSASRGDSLSSPAVARRQVRLALRKAREAKGRTQGDVAAHFSWSLSMVQRIESGEVSVSGTDLRALLDLLEVTDDDAIKRLLEAGRISRRQRWTTDADFRDYLTPAYNHLLQFEAAAVAIRTYQLVVVPGPMQTPEYAQTLLSLHHRTLSPEERRVRFDVRMQRRRLLDPGSGMQYLVILDESVLKREVGGLETMAGQLEALAVFADQPNVKIRIVPLQYGAYLGMVGPFTVLDLDADDPSDAVVYRESFARDEMAEDPDEISEFRERFESLWQSALDEGKSARLILAEAAQLRSRNDRR